MTSKPHILVVDNDKDTLNVIMAMLERLGYNAQGELRSLTALRTFSDAPDEFDLVIIEPVLPELTGVELAVRFRRIRRGCPVMLYAGYIDPSLTEIIFDAGLKPAVLKPLGLLELGEAVKDALPN